MPSSGGMAKGPKHAGAAKTTPQTGDKRKRSEAHGGRGHGQSASSPAAGGSKRGGKGDENPYATAGLVKPEAFANARAAEILAAAALIPPLVSSGAAGDRRLGVARQRMVLRRRAASYRPYKFSLAVRQKLHAKRARTDPDVPIPGGLPALCRARRRAVSLLAARQLQGRPTGGSGLAGGAGAAAAGGVWLATHLWHTKRMVMGELFGMRVALKRADAGERAAVRCFFFFFFFTLVTGPRWSLSLELSDTRVYDPQIFEAVRCLPRPPPRPSHPCPRRRS